MSITRRKLLAQSVSTGVAASLMPWHSANAQQGWPNKTIRLVNMSPPGAPPDTFGRLYADRLGKALGVPVVVDNKPGAGGNIASDIVAKSAPDGYTLLYTVSSAFVMNPFIYRKLPFDVEKDFKPVSPVLGASSILVANNDLPFKSLQELVAYAKQHPGNLAYASYGIGGGPHLIMELFAQAAQIQMLHVPYKTGPMPDVVSGQVQLLAEPPASALPMIKLGKVRAIAHGGPKRHPQLPDVPAIAEIYPDVSVWGWQGIWAPAGVPNDIIQRLNAELAKITRAPEVTKQIQDLGAQPMSATPENMASMITTEARMWGDLIRAKNITVD